MNRNSLNIIVEFGFVYFCIFNGLMVIAYFYIFLKKVEIYCIVNRQFKINLPKNYNVSNIFHIYNIIHNIKRHKIIQ